jgi:zinc transporter ZupT
MNWFLLILSVLSGALLALKVPSNSKIFKYLLSFSGAFLFGTLFTHLLPEVFEGGAVEMGWWVLLGFGIQLFLDYLSEGLEHGHFHSHGRAIPWLAITGLLLHAFIEGMPLTSGHSHDHAHGAGGFLWAIALHKIPIALLVTAALRQNGIAPQKIGFVIALFAIASPAGALLASNFLLDPTVSLRLLALASGLLLHVSTTILFESSQNHQFNLMKLAYVILGMLLAGALNLWL